MGKPKRLSAARRREHAEYPFHHTPPKQYTPEELRDLGRRAWEVSRQLAEVTEKLNAAIRLAEERFVMNLGAERRGRVAIRKNKDGWIEHLTFKDGKFFYEDGWPGEPLEVRPLLSASREIRCLAANHLAALWSACGGGPLPERK